MHRVHVLIPLIPFPLSPAHKGFWSDLLGLGDFYYELAIQLMEVCYLTRETNGGIISVEEMLRLLRRRRGTRAQQIEE